MPASLPRQHRDFLWLNLAFAALCAIVIGFGAMLPIGVRLLALVLVYNVAAGCIGWRRRNAFWLRLWLFSVVFGILNVVPDMYLTAAGLLVFPHDGVFRIVNIAGYMPLLWPIPMFALLYLAFWSTGLPPPRPSRAGFVRLWLGAAVVFGAAEHGFGLIGSWHVADGVAYTLGGAALYVLIAEFILMSLAYPLSAWGLTRPAWVRAGLALLLMLGYLAALFGAFLVIETG